MPWGQVRGSGIPQTSRNYTGQQLDGTGLLYYHARSYDPALARFISPDTIVPGSGALTLAPSDAMVRAAWGLKSGGPTDPQQLNRYSYGLNNPVKNTDPTGHCVFAGIDTLACAAAAAEVFVYAVGLAAASYAVVDGVQQTATTLQATQQGPEGEQTDTNASDTKPAVAHVPNLTGKHVDDAAQDIEGAGFEPKPDTAGGYKRWYHPDGSRIWVDPEGKVDRVGPKTALKDPTDPSKGTYRPRYGPDGKPLRPDQSHDTGEVVKRGPR